MIRYKIETGRQANVQPEGGAMKLVQEVRQVVTQVLDGKEALGGLANVV